MRLFQEHQTVTAGEVRQLLVENLKHIDRLLEESRLPGTSCGGYVAEFDTAVVIISFDDFNNNWILECGSSSSN